MRRKLGVNHLLRPERAVPQYIVTIEDDPVAGLAMLLAFAAMWFVFIPALFPTELHANLAAWCRGQGIAYQLSDLGANVIEGGAIVIAVGLLSKMAGKIMLLVFGGILAYHFFGKS